MALPSPSRNLLSSKDPIAADTNAWMRPKKKRASNLPALSSTLVRLAHRLDRTPEELARSYPKDTTRRLKYPVLEFDEGGGKTRYQHDLGIREGVRST